MFITKNAAGTIFIEDAPTTTDPALQVHTFENNDRLTAALARIGKRNTPPELPKIGIEYYSGKAKPHRAYVETGGEKKYLGYFKLEADAWRAASGVATHSK